MLDGMKKHGRRKHLKDEEVKSSTIQTDFMDRFEKGFYF